MRFDRLLCGALAAGALAAFVGCQANSTAPTPVATTQSTKASADDGEAAAIKASMAKLSPEDRKLAEAQKTCPISGEPLGSMGVPIKVMLDGKPAFVCCKGCSKDAEKDPAGTLKKIADAKASAK